MPKCRKRRYTDFTVDTALRAMRLRDASKTHTLEKTQCLECKSWHIVRGRSLQRTINICQDKILRSLLRAHR